VTNIIGDIAVIREINSRAEMTSVTTARPLPAICLYNVNVSMQVVDEEGKAFASLEDVLMAHDCRILPAFRVDNRNEAEALMEYLDYRHFHDCMLVSSDPELMRFMREYMPSAMGVIDYTETYGQEAALTTEQCLDIRRSMKINNGTVALLPPHLCGKDTVQYLFEHQVNVWTRLSDEPTLTEQYHALLSGAVGVISDASDSLLDIACNQLPEKTLTRSPLNVGHRGIPSMAPECTVEGSLLAYKQSANVVEMDVFLTTDGQVAAMHDMSTGDTCNKNLNMESSTLAELKELYVNRGWENHPKYNDLRIPTLNEYLEAFKGKDCMLFIEIKSHKREIVGLIRDMVNEYDMYDQCAIITFNTDTMEYMREDWPEMSLGYLTNAFYQGDNPPEMAVRWGMEFAGPFNGTMNPEHDVYDGRGVRALMIRGVSVYPWTFYTSLREYSNHFLWGSAGLTGNDADKLKLLAKRVDTFPIESVMETGETLPLDLNVTSYIRRTMKKDYSVFRMLEGEELVQATDNLLTITGESGQFSFILGYTEPALGYTILTQPVTVSIYEEAETTLPATEPTTTAPSESETAPQAKGGCGSAISAASLVVIAAAIPALWMRKRRED
jgi:glycerophosphoryl diester phosphodiesterase